MSHTLNILLMTVVTGPALFHLRPVKGRSGAWEWMKKSVLGLIDGSGELCPSGLVNNFASMRMSGQSRGTWMKNVGNYKMVKMTV